MTAKKSFFQTAAGTVLLAGLAAGTLDILAAFLVYSLIVANVPPTQILKSIASGVFGKQAFAGGAPMAVCGLFFHYIIALSWALLYFLIFPLIPFFKKQRIVSGLIYGVFVWVMMNLVVLPLSNVNQSPLRLKSALIGAIILMICIGLPISLITHRFYASRDLS
ncbi:MAG: hypothetical protein R2747_10730 [Pyrinomonadaceae bacterium]